MTDTPRRLDGLLVAVLAFAGASTSGLWPISALLGDSVGDEQCQTATHLRAPTENAWLHARDEKA